MEMYRLLGFGAVIIVSCLVNGCGSSREIADLKHEAGRGSEGRRGDEDVAKKMFAQRCLGAGEIIKKRVENVEGIFLLKLRPQKLNFSNQYALDDPYGSDFTGDAYIRSFLRGFYELNYRKPDHPVPNALPHVGYRYVDAIDTNDGKRYRYMGIVEQPGLKDPTFLKDYRRFVLKRVVSDDPAPRYGVTYEDISTKGNLELPVNSA
ncbi:hypothetical protein [Massilia violaceinigra]|uniref:hypothetical protein n=1 Tax=Massilia violaceinigra TaxID=2045208 RepID=UPI0012FDCF87|nr:hypothetical protein [Massilia violaceinigra]